MIEAHARAKTRLLRPGESRFAAILDCCHSGGLTREGGLRPRGIDPPDDIRHRALRWNRRLEMWEERRLPAANRSLASDPRFVGRSGATYRIGRGVSLRGLPNRAYDRVVQDVHRLACCRAVPEVLWCQHHNGIFRSVDGGESFAALEPVAPSAFGFAVAAHPRDPDTAWFVPAVKDECRVPVDGRLTVTRTRDGGRSFEALGEGLPRQGAYDLIYRHALDVDAGGTRLAMGSTTGNLWIGEAGGARWTLVSTHLPPVAQVAFG